MQTLGHLYPVPPYNFRLTLDLISHFPHPNVDLVHDSAYWRVVRVAGHLLLLHITQPHRGSLVINCAASSGEIDTQIALDRAAHILCTELDVSDFYAYAQEHPDLYYVIKPIQGLRWLRTETVYEALMTTIIEQQIAWKAAQKAQRWLVEWAGNRITYQGRDYFAFPTPDQIAAATIDDLTPLKITFRRMAVMIELSRQVVQGKLDIEQILTLPIDVAYRKLVTLQGIGHWTAAWTIQRAHGISHLVGHNDVALQAAVSHYFYGGNERISEQQVQATFSRYGAYAGMAAHHTILRWVMDRY
jgi:DNA-3-methyladenine glycosylase II